MHALENISGFTYCKSIKVAHGVKLPPNANGCDCKGSCIASRTCSCAKLNGLDFPYVHRDGGRSGFHSILIRYIEISLAWIFYEWGCAFSFLDL